MGIQELFYPSWQPPTAIEPSHFTGKMFIIDRTHSSPTT